jgi:hypothetical protein
MGRKLLREKKPLDQTVKMVEVGRQKSGPSDRVYNTDPHPAQPKMGLLCKLVSIVVHADEAMSSDRHEFDFSAINALLKDAEVTGWIEDMTKMGLAPVKRKAKQ